MKARRVRAWRGSTAFLLIGVCVAALCLGTFAVAWAQQAPGQPAAPGGRGGGRGGVGGAVFTGADANRDGYVTRDELRSWLTGLLTGGATSLTGDQLSAALMAGLIGGGGSRGAAPQPTIPNPDDVTKMMAALPDKAPARPQRARKVLVLSKASGFVHSCIPLAGKTVEAIGTKTGAWTTTITYNPADINPDNLKQYDLVFLNNTTGAFLDDPKDSGTTAARQKALLDFVRNGKGLAGIHAATDAYHAAETSAAGGRGGRAGGGIMTPLVSEIIKTGDKNNDQRLTRDELSAVADAWFAQLDTANAGRVSQQDFATRFAAIVPQPARPAGGQNAPPPQGRDNQIGTWPDYNKMIGGFFKFHWLDPQLITTKIDDPKSPITACFNGQEFEIHDETYTFGMNTWSRGNLHILTSIDYDKMSVEDKAKEANPRSDHDYGLSWIRREGKGRVFYEAHGHSERVYAIKPMLEHILAGMQYAIGDLKADDSPSVKPRGGR